MTEVELQPLERYYYPKLVTIIIDSQLIVYLCLDAALTRENEQENSWYLPCVGDQHLLHWQQLPGQMGRTRTRGGVTHQGIDSDTGLQHHHLCTKKAVLQG